MPLESIPTSETRIVEKERKILTIWLIEGPILLKSPTEVQTAYKQHTGSTQAAYRQHPASRKRTKCGACMEPVWSLCGGKEETICGLDRDWISLFVKFRFLHSSSTR